MVKRATKVDEKIGAALAEARERCGLSQDVVAKAGRVTRQQIQKYEEGATRLTVAKLILIAPVLKIRASSLVRAIEAAV